MKNHKLEVGFLFVLLITVFLARQDVLPRFAAVWGLMAGSVYFLFVRPLRIYAQKPANSTLLMLLSAVMGLVLSYALVGLYYPSKILEIAFKTLLLLFLIFYYFNFKFKQKSARTVYWFNLSMLILSYVIGLVVFE